MSAAQLRALADKIEKQEAAEKAAQIKEEIASLKTERKSLVSDHKKALSAIDRKIARLTGKGAKPGRSKRGGSASAAIVDFVGKSGKATTKEIKAALEKKGISTANLNQTLAYLKRQNRISSPSRAVYKLK